METDMVNGIKPCPCSTSKFFLKRTQTQIKLTQISDSLQFKDDFFLIRICINFKFSTCVII